MSTSMTFMINKQSGEGVSFSHMHRLTEAIQNSSAVTKAEYTTLLQDGMAFWLCKTTFDHRPDRNERGEILYSSREAAKIPAGVVFENQQVLS